MNILSVEVPHFLNYPSQRKSRKPGILRPLYLGTISWRLEPGCSKVTTRVQREAVGPKGKENSKVLANPCQDCVPRLRVPVWAT